MIDTTQRKVWLRALRRFKYGIRVRAKLGVLDAVAARVGAERRNRSRWDRPDWDDPRWIDLLYVAIRDEQFPDELLAGFAKTAEVTFFSQTLQPPRDAILKAIDQVLRQRSLLLRQRFGVITDDIPATLPVVAIHEDGSQEAGQADAAS